MYAGFKRIELGMNIGADLGERITVEEDWRLEPDDEGMDIQAVVE